MQAAEIVEILASSSDNSPVVTVLPEDVIVLPERAGIAAGAGRIFRASVRPFPPAGARGRAAHFISVDIPLVGRNGEVSGVLCRSVPITEATNAPACVDQQLEAINEITKVVAHDINNLLAVLDSGLRLLERRSDPEVREVIVGKMRSAVARGAALSRRLLDGTRPQATAHEFAAHRHLVAFGGALDQTLCSDVSVRTELGRDLWEFNADPEELYFALLNLCRNAADAMPRGGTVVLSARNVNSVPGTADDFVEITVADDGDGMPEDVLSRVFEPYFTTKASGRGTGLGLAQVQRFVERQGGAIEIESESGLGTRVRLVFPRTVPHASARPACGAPADHAAGGRPKIAYAPSIEGDGGLSHLVGVGVGARNA